MNTVQVKAITGRYEGFIDENGVYNFLGIPYVERPERWKVAKPLKPSDQLVTALEYSPCCWQNWEKEEFDQEPPMSEDSLTLNIWTADLNREKKPVMIWIHGGSYVTGSNRIDCCHGMYCGDRFVKSNPDIIYININYRLNAFGSMDFSLVDQTGDYKDSSNLQTHDQLSAIKWVYENIEAFGGDKENITIFGQSAGGYSIATLLLVEETKKYVKKAICQSSAIDETLKTDEQAQMIGKQFLEITGAKTMEDCIKLTPQEVLKAVKVIMENPIFPAFCGKRDGYFIPQKPYEALENGSAGSIIVMNGTTAGEYESMTELVQTEEELTGFSKFAYTKPITDEMIEEYIGHYPERSRKTALQDLFNDSMRLTHIKMSDCLTKAGNDVYHYYISYQDEEDKVRPQHCFEIPYITERTGEELYMSLQLGEPIPGRNPSKKLQKQIQGCWAQFARTGNPNGDHISITWEKYTVENRNTMVIDKEWEMKNGVRNEDIDLFIEYATTI